MRISKTNKRISLAFLIGILFGSPGFAQSGTTLQEDFYQPVQELWNGVTQSPDISSDFEPSSAGPSTTLQAPVAPSYSAPTYSGPAYTGPTYTESAPPMASEYTQDGAYPVLSPAAPIESQTLPNIVGPVVNAPQTSVVGEVPAAPAQLSEPVPAPPVPVPNANEVITPAPMHLTEPVPVDGGAPFGMVADPYPQNYRMFFRWDRLSGLVDQNDGTTIGNPNAAGIFIQNGIPFPFTNSISTAALDNNTEWGDRFEFGELGPRGGWLAGILDWNQLTAVNSAGGGIQFGDPVGMLLGYSDSNGDGRDDDVDGDNIYGRDGVDLGTPDPDNPGGFLPVFDGIIDGPSEQDTGDLVTFVPVFDNVTISSDLDIMSFELMRALRRQRGGGRFGFTQHWLFGVRYIDLDERFSINGGGSFFSSMNINSTIENYIIGPQIGTELCRRFGNLRVAGTGRFMLAANFLRGDQAGTFTPVEGPGGRNQPLNLGAGAFSNTAEDEDFSPVVEWRVDVAYDIGRHLAARVGYTGMFIGGLGRAANSIDYTLPSFGLNLDADDDLFFNAFTAGLEFYF